MTVDELIRYYYRMDHARERVAVTAEQLPEFLAGFSSVVNQEIERDSGIYYVREAGYAPWGTQACGSSSNG